MSSIHNYTENAWQGQNYNPRLTTKEIAGLIRKQLKKEFPECKFSVRYKSFSGGSEINVSLMAAKFKVFNIGTGYLQVNHYWLDKQKELTPEAVKVLKRVTKIVNSYNYDDSDPQIDYFNTNFYFMLEIGKWDRFFERLA